MICPCKDCEKKGCGVYHSKCEKYLKFVEWKKDINERERKSKQFVWRYFGKERRNFLKNKK